MRRLFAITLLLASLCCFAAACSKSGNLNGVDDKTELVSPSGNNSVVPAGKGRPAKSAIDDAPASEAPPKSPLPPPTGFVNDYAKVINEPAKKELEDAIARLKKNSRIEFAVVTVETTGERPHSDYADAVARGWGIGPRDKTGGSLILLVAIKDRRWVLRWSRSLAEDLEEGTEDELKGLMTVPFRRGNYGEGIKKGVKAVISRLAERRGFSPR